MDRRKVKKLSNKNLLLRYKLNYREVSLYGLDGRKSKMVFFVGLNSREKQDLLASSVNNILYKKNKGYLNITSSFVNKKLIGGNKFLDVLLHFKSVSSLVNFKLTD